MMHKKLMWGLLFLTIGTVAAQQPAGKEAEVTPLMTKALPDVPGKEVVMLTVVYPPESQDPVHRHNADGFIYVLEGSIVMQVRGGKEVTLTPGQTFTRDRTTFTSWAATRARRSRRNSWCFC